MYVEKSSRKAIIECCHIQPQKTGHEITYLPISTQYRSFTLKNQDNMIEALSLISNVKYTPCKYFV